jgi:hypothetical protein
MYTYLISIAVFFLVSAMIFKGKIQQNIFSVILIVVAGSFVSTAAVNGILSSKVKYEKTLVRKEVHLPQIRTFHFNDSTKIEICRLGDRVKSTAVSTKDRTLQEGEFTLHFKESGDSTKPGAYFNKYKDVPVTDCKWISTVGIPRKNVHWDIYLPNDSLNRAMVTIINERIRKSHENKPN